MAALLVMVVLNITLIALVSFLATFLNRQIKEYNHLRRNYSTITVLQKILEVFGAKISADKKMTEVNNIFLKDFNIMFSTIVSYSDNGHVIKVSNVEPSYYDDLKSLGEFPMFKTTGSVPKYVTSGSPSKLGYNGANERGIRSVLFCPLSLQGSYAGYWLLEDTRQNAFDRLDKVQLSILKNNLSLIIENSNYESAMEKMAIRDKLTGVYNRNYLYTSGINLINQYDKAVVVICDIDFFKKVNDTYGHDIGDKVLANVAHITGSHLSEKDMLIRFGGEEFVIVYPGESIETCKEKVEKLRLSIAASQVEIIPDKIVKVTVSYGMSLYNKGEDIDKVIKSADTGLYRAKQNGRNRIEIVE